MQDVTQQLNAAHAMSNLPYRTNATSLSDDELIILDAIFDGGASFELLRRSSFHPQWNLGYAHNLNDEELRCRLRRLCEQSILKTEYDCRRTYYCMTPTGGDLWSQERCPSWDRYCTERYKTTRRGLTLMSVVAVSPEIRDKFLMLWPMPPARRRTATIPGNRLIFWRSFSQLHVGLATYREETEWTSEEYDVYCQRDREHSAILRRERSWWRTVPELQRFLPNAA